MTLKTRLHGKVHKFGDDVTADDIIAGKHRPKVENVLDLKPYAPGQDSAAGAKAPAWAKPK